MLVIDATVIGSFHNYRLHCQHRYAAFQSFSSPRHCYIDFHPHTLIFPDICIGNRCYCIWLVSQLSLAFLTYICCFSSPRHSHVDFCPHSFTSKSRSSGNPFLSLFASFFFTFPLRSILFSLFPFFFPLYTSFSSTSHSFFLSLPFPSNFVRIFPSCLFLFSSCLFFLLVFFLLPFSASPLSFAQAYIFLA